MALLRVLSAGSACREPGLDSSSETIPHVVVVNLEKWSGEGFRENPHPLGRGKNQEMLCFNSASSVVLITHAHTTISLPLLSSLPLVLSSHKTSQHRGILSRESQTELNV